MDHRHRRQVGADLAQRGVIGCLRARDEELDAGRLERVRGVRQSCLDDRRRRQFGDVEDCAGTVVVGHRFAQHVVGQPGHHADTRIGFPCQQSDFEIYRVVVPGADHGGRAHDPGLDEVVLGVGDVVVDQLDDGRAGVLQLFGDRRRQRVVTADDDVAVHAHRASQDVTLL
ncbi:hypothetical protein MSTO_53850 [Mycobacterium stomatepiae]|uniref:Uncharacterized protein n=1 Tax=Mycobacterium stomatepiae TaxID=470076 RepID=A0A7I7QGB5_9MYCO|nr:hypothetical protein MSTO_53850 [Mycobacterium stomatepiae]